MKYPRTQHIESSRLQVGDEDLSQIPWSELVGKYLIIEEKIDGANCGISFNVRGEMILQSRGHSLNGGPGEKQFALFKQWAAAQQAYLFDVLEDRFILYGEWMYAKHTVFYDHLPHYFMEFDVYDIKRAIFLSTAARNELFDRGIIEPVRVLVQGRFEKLEEILEFVGASRFKTPGWRAVLQRRCAELGLDIEKIRGETDLSHHMEGLYIKWEERDEVKGRYKWVRPDFLQAIMDSGTHWKARPILPNKLMDGADIFRGKG